MPHFVARPNDCRLLSKWGTRLTRFENSGVGQLNHRLMIKPQRKKTRTLHVHANVVPPRPLMHTNQQLNTPCHSSGLTTSSVPYVYREYIGDSFVARSSHLFARGSHQPQ